MIDAYLYSSIICTVIYGQWFNHPKSTVLGEIDPGHRQCTERSSAGSGLEIEAGPYILFDFLKIKLSNLIGMIQELTGIKINLVPGSTCPKHKCVGKPLPAGRLLGAVPFISNEHRKIIALFTIKARGYGLKDWNVDFWFWGQNHILLSRYPTAMSSLFEQRTSRKVVYAPWDRMGWRNNELTGIFP